MRRCPLLILLALALAPAAGAHAPTTAIGRAVEALGAVDVSYGPGAAVSEVEAGGFERLAGDGLAVAVLPASALTEVRGGPEAVAAEIAREARVDGTLVVLVGTRLAAVSDAIPAARLQALLGQSAAGPPAARVDALLRALRAQQPAGGSGTPRGWIAAGATLVITTVMVLMARRGRASPGPGDPKGRPYE